MDWSYIAGFFDGEGCVTLHSGKSGHVALSLRISQKHPQALEEIVNFLTYGRVRPTHGGNHHLLLISKTEDQRHFLRGIRPHAIVKKEQVELGLRMTDLMGKQWLKVSPEVAEERQRIAGLIRKANRL